MAAERATKEDLQKLERLLVDLEEAEKLPYSHVRDEKDYAFHQHIIAMSGNSILAELMEWSRLQFILLQVVELQQIPGKPMLASHRDLFKAIKRGDGELAEKLARKHCSFEQENETD